jgi:Ca2+/H+ antiporter, TMEM165/GDT1 family
VAPLAALLLVFAVVGGLELLDRTNFALLGLAARRPGVATWAGAATAFLATSAIAVAIGTLVLATLSAYLRYVELAGGLLILAFALYLARSPAEAPARDSRRGAFVSAFLLIFLLELGDTTMILLVLFTGSLRDPVGVYLAGSVALLSVAAFACWAGGRLGARLAPRVLKRAVVTILLIVGSVTVLLAAFPGLLAGLPF